MLVEDFIFVCDIGRVKWPYIVTKCVISPDVAGNSMILMMLYILSFLYVCCVLFDLNDSVGLVSIN
ncbi:hypothetical protein VIN01S_10210 [Vibrio inusitatus NBRC 102082]|uniref:Uncharacterized protein n=1 Tax=Vibrio inusitatus NBRC 102082 TaxID=1219070 RepID=A0A4Y3HT53_9VIBR|nr:hypothetical protein VIN01S_10210 [Vibrio inusitatus NBRC 102082]